MAAFIVISTDNKLHDLVDDIEKCRPRNPHVETYISTGKIIRTESGEYTYRYTIYIYCYDTCWVGFGWYL